MRKIRLSQGTRYTLVDDADYHWLKQWKWSLFISRHPRTTKIREYAVRHPLGRVVAMHREILGLSQNSKLQGDHIDGNGLNNQRRNLRVATNRQNVQNSKKRTGCLSRFKGVTRYKNTTKKKWIATIQLSDRRIVLGYFTSQREAAKAYDKAALKYFGKFARLNGV